MTDGAKLSSAEAISNLNVMKGRRESSSEDIWQQERENWARQKEELKAWALAQTQANEGSPKVKQY